MRKIVNLTKPKDGIVRLMIFNDDYGTYLFGYKKNEDCGADWDEWYETENDAMESVLTEFGVRKLEWSDIPDPELNCQHDWINPVRVKECENGQLKFGKMERLVNGKWTEFEPNE
jgi:biofilm protein TabA